MMHKTRHQILLAILMLCSLCVAQEEQQQFDPLAHHLDLIRNARQKAELVVGDAGHQFYPELAWPRIQHALQSWEPAK